MSDKGAVLIVDDNIDLAENLKEILEDEGAEVEAVAGGRQALARLEQREFSMVITDIRMPGMDGITVLKEINARWPQLLVVVMTAFSADDVIAEAYAEGALEVLSKPIDIGRIVQLVERLGEHNAPILFIEDDDDLRVNLVEAMMDIAKLVPYTASDLSSALRMVEEKRFRAAIIDVHLPDGDGAAFGRELKARDPNIEIIYITGYRSVYGQVRELIEKNDSMHLIEKPFHPERLLSLLRSKV